MSAYTKQDLLELGFSHDEISEQLDRTKNNTLSRLNPKMKIKTPSGGHMAISTQFATEDVYIKIRNKR